MIPVKSFAPDCEWDELYLYVIVLRRYITDGIVIYLCFFR